MICVTTPFSFLVPRPRFTMEFQYKFSISVGFRRGVMGLGSRLRNRRGISEVISAVILTAVVLTTGCTVWFYARSAATVMTNDYVNASLTLKQEILERFVVERVFYDSSGDELQVWISNYGTVDATVDIYVTPSVGGLTTSFGNALGSKTLAMVGIPCSISGGTSLSIKVHSLRGNNAYYTYTIP